MAAQPQALSDDQKRAAYDRYGHEGPQMRGPAGGFHGGQPMRPEDIFAHMFDGGAGFAFAGGPGMRFHFAGPGGQRYSRRGPQGGSGAQARQQEDVGFGLMQLMPLIMVLLFTFLNFGGNESSGTSSQYTFARDQHHPTKRSTAARDIKYFVRPGFEREVNMRFGEKSQWMEEFEARVEIDYHAQLKKQCESESKAKDKEYRAALQRQDTKAAKGAYHSPAKACERLYEHFGEYY